MPDSFGKRNREKIRAEKAEAREARRIARSERRRGTIPAPEPSVVEDPRPVEATRD